MSDINRVQLDDAVRRARAILDQHPDGDLPLGYRHMIWAALGSRGGTWQRSAGQRRRTALACLAGRRVLPIWIRTLPQDTGALAALVEAERVLHGLANLQSASLLRDRTMLDLGGRLDLPVDVRCAGFAAAAALTTAINDEKFDPADANPNRDDRDVDAQYLDAAFFGASAEAGGPVWTADSNVERRRGFWRWWIADALAKTLATEK